MDYKERIKLIGELEIIKSWLREHDYIINKIVLGEWEKTDPRFLDYLEERAVKRQRQDELLALIGV